MTKRGGKTVVSKNERHVLQYGDPQSLTAETVVNLGRRWQQNTLSFVLDRGSTDYAWLVPGEVPGVNHGGLAYRFTAASGVPPRVFPVVSSVQPR